MNYLLKNKNTIKPISFLVDELELAKSKIDDYENNKLKKIEFNNRILFIIAKYLKSNKYKKPNNENETFLSNKEIEEFLLDYSKKQFTRYNELNFSKSIKSIVNRASKSSLQKKIPIKILKSEMDTILQINIDDKSFNKDKICKILFYMLVQAKLLKAMNTKKPKENDTTKEYRYFIKMNSNYFFTKSGVDIRKTTERAKYINYIGKLQKDGVSIVQHDIKFGKEILFVDKSWEDDNVTPEIEIKHFHNTQVMMYFDEYIDKLKATNNKSYKLKYIRCEGCDCVIKNTANATKFCNLCAKKSINKSNAESKIRNSDELTRGNVAVNL